MKYLYEASAIELTFLPPTNQRGDRVRFTSHHLRKSFVRSWDYGAGNNSKKGLHGLASQILQIFPEKEILGYYQTKKGYLVVLKNWEKVKQAFGIKD